MSRRGVAHAVRRSYTECRTKVMLPCSKEWEKTSEVDFLNIEEGPQGEDIMTYRCRNCGKVHKSTVYGS